MAALFAVTSISTLAQTSTTPPPPGAGMSQMHRHDPAKMQAMMAKRQAELKAKLNITAVQEPAWAAYTTAMKPPDDWKPADMQARRAEIEKLPTPERVDKMQALRTERMSKMNAEMDKRGAATKSFYAALSAEQQKTFDAERQAHRGASWGAGSRGGMHGDHPRQSAEPKKG